MNPPAPIGDPRLDLFRIGDDGLRAELLLRLFNQLGFGVGHAAAIARLADRRDSEEPDPPPARGASIARSSTIVFHSPQPGQRPCHLGLSFPHWEQTKRVLAIHPR